VDPAGKGAGLRAYARMPEALFSDEGLFIPEDFDIR
jgi:hypothetical protein